ncbi:hypothetical protein KPPK1081_10 [Klebsiella phage KPPK108.1]|uniref:Uncharacterized protein n=1 Tax=Klebsiella phage KPPK108.1 TaxID=2894584 RepID=A0AAE8YHF2_9CAUD|nr:hypothetical protein KPPK1081_10 [Klebsiella phage KPPK108.1]
MIMSKFKIGDKVVLAPGTGCATDFYALQGDRDYYTVTDVASDGAFWLQLDFKACNRVYPYPWPWAYFNMYQEPEEGLPPVPDSVYYPDMFTLLTGKRAAGGTSGLTVRQSPYTAEAISLSIDHSKWTRLDADAALQLAHDLRRMAMDIKRKDK